MENFEKGREEEKCIDFKSNIIKTNLEDCYIIEENRFGDSSGYFTSVTSKQLEALDFRNWSQKSESMSAKGTIRGLHFQRDPYCQAKVVSCTKGAVLDVVVDMRKDSPTYGKYTAIELTPENGRMLYVPRGYAHGFLALTDDATFNYMVDNEYAPRMEGGVLWNDPAINIPWDEIFKKYGIDEPLLSDKDKYREPLSESEVNFLRRTKKYLVTGVNGQLGYDIVKELNGKLNRIFGKNKNKGFSRRIANGSCMASGREAVTILPDGKVGICNGMTYDVILGDIYTTKIDVKVREKFGRRFYREDKCRFCPVYPDCHIVSGCPIKDDNEGCEPVIVQMKIKEIIEKMKLRCRLGASEDEKGLT